MSPIRKPEIIAAWKKATTWGTEVDVNAAGNGVLVLNPGVPKVSIPNIRDESAGLAFYKELGHGDQPAAGFSLEANTRYEGLGTIIAQLFGTAGTPTQQGATAAYLHELRLKKNIEDIFGTYAVTKHDKIHVVPSVKLHKLTFTFGDGLLKLTADMMGNDVIDDSAVITAMDSVTYPGDYTRTLVEANHGVFRMNAQDGAALAGSDEVKIKNMTLEIERQDMKEFHEMGDGKIDEPLGMKPLIKLVIEMNKMDDGNKGYFADWKAKTEKKADLIFTGPLIEDTYYYYFKFQFPRLRIVDPGAEYDDDDIIPARLTMEGLEADSAPTGMTGITKPVALDIMNKRTTDTLA